MTTIATDGRRIAADGLTIHRGTVVRTTAYKINRLSDGSFIAGAGDVALFTKAISAIRNKEPGGDHLAGDYSLLRLSKWGAVSLYDGTGTLEPIYIDGPAAIGSGMDYALAAMKAGASPQKAVRIAAELDPNTGGRVTVERIS